MQDRLPDSGLPYAAAGLVGALAQVVGGWWDVAWHGSLGRDSLWSAPHLLIYAGVLLLLAVGAAGLARGIGAHGEVVVAAPGIGPAHTGFLLAAAGPVVQLVSAPYS